MHVLNKYEVYKVVIIVHHCASVKKNLYREAMEFNFCYKCLIRASHPKFKSWPMDLKANIFVYCHRYELIWYWLDIFFGLVVLYSSSLCCHLVNGICCGCQAGCCLVLSLPVWEIQSELVLIDGVIFLSLISLILLYYVEISQGGFSR